MLAGVGLLYGIPYALIFGIRDSIRQLTNDIQTVEVITFTWRKAVIGLGTIVVMIGLLSAIPWLTIQLPFLFADQLDGSTSQLVQSGRHIDVETLKLKRLVDKRTQMLSLLPYGLLLLTGIWLILVTGVLAGIGKRVLDRKHVPNQGIWLTGKNAILSGLVTSLFNGLIIWLTTASSIAAIDVALSSGLLMFLWMGGFELVHHLVLRLILWWQGHIPWNYSRFLDHATALIFLRKVGGGYIFVHRLIMEHFTTLDEKDIERITTPSNVH
jgi:hypothetical protein